MRYAVNVFHSDEDGGYIADIPDLQYCSAFGETPFEALEEVEKAKAAWIASARKLRKQVPKPTCRPVIYQLTSA